MSHKRETEERTQRAIEQIRESRLSDDESQQIADRVWERLENHVGTAEEAEVGTIRGCDDYQTLIPAFLSGSLAPSRALLVEEHSRNCVPCRRALKAARSGVGAPTAPSRSSTRPSQLRRWALAATIAVAAVGTGYFVWNQGPALPYGAIVEVDGAGLYRTATLERLQPGAEIAVGEEVRAAPGQTSILRLADGSSIEVRGRSEVAIESARRGTTVRVDAGSVIVEAAPQHDGRLFVSTDDCLVSVKGTIFTVSSGTRGSRVAVVEGEVHVDYAGSEKVLHAGDRTATYAGSPVFAVRDELAWSQDVDRYLAVLQEVTELREALKAELPRPGLRYSSRLLEHAPDNLVFYAAFPNLVETLVEADRIVRERISQSTVLEEWWSKNEGSGLDRHMELTAMLSEAGDYIGEEIVVTGSLDEAGEINGPIILAELTDPQAMRDWLEQVVTEAAGETGEMPSLIFLDDAETPSGGSDESLFVWLGSDTLIAAPRADLVREAAARRGSAASGLKARLAEVYQTGAETLVAMDAREIATTLGHTEGAEAQQQAERLGLLEASHLIFQQKRFEDRTDNSAVLAFDGPRTGLAGWLAEPAPMGSLRYVSPDAKLVASAIVVDPTRIVDELIAIAQSEDGTNDLTAFEQKLGLSLKDDFAAALGGEFTLALDGPVVPSPAWKLVAEVYDPEKFVWAMQQLLSAANDERATEGLAPIEWSEETSGGRTYYGIAGDQSAQMAFDEGYLVAAANRGLVDRAIRYRQSGYTLESSSRFAKLMPNDGRENFSALLYQDALELLGPLAERIAQGDLTPEQSAAIEALSAQTEPTLAYAYGEERQITFAARGAFDLLTSGLPGMIGLGGFCLDELPMHEQPDAVDETSPSPEA